MTTGTALKGLQRRAITLDYMFLRSIDWSCTMRLTAVKSHWAEPLLVHLRKQKGSHSL